MKARLYQPGFHVYVPEMITVMSKVVFIGKESYNISV